MNLIEAKKSSTLVSIGISLIALAINLIEFVLIAWLITMCALYIVLPIVHLMHGATVGANTLAKPLTFIPVALTYLCALAIPQLVAAFNSYVLASLAGSRKVFFAKSMAFSGIAWAVGGGAWLMSLFLLDQHESSSLAGFILPIAIILGCPGQFFFASRIAKGVNTRTERKHSNFGFEINSKIENIANAKTYEEVEALAIECLSLMTLPQLSLSRTDDYVQILIDQLVEAEMPAEANIVSSRMMHFLVQE